MRKSDIGVIGLGTMGRNLALNLSHKGWDVSVWDREKEVLNEYAQGAARDTSIKPFEELNELVDSLQSPRVILLMISAGQPVDEMIERLLPLIAPSDILMDGGNSYFKDTARRVDYLRSKSIFFLGVGISGGEEGALHGASIMPGGAEEAWPIVRPFLKSIAARASDGRPCCEWIGPGAAGHYVKMVHNGLEYADMQLITELYSMLSHLTSLSNDEMADVFAEWNKGRLQSYLLEITTKILSKKDKDGTYLLNHILDVASQKGTGSWCVDSALELGIPLNTIASAVFMRNLSGAKDIREQMYLDYRPFQETRPVYNTDELT